MAQRSRRGRVGREGGDPIEESESEYESLASWELEGDPSRLEDVQPYFMGCLLKEMRAGEKGVNKTVTK